MKMLYDSVRPMTALLLAAVLGLGVAGCSDGDDGADGAQGPEGPAGAEGPAGPPGADGISCWDLNANGTGDLPGEDLNGDGVVDVLDCNPASAEEAVRIGDGSGLTAEQIEAMGQLVATIDGVTVSSPPVVEFTVTDSQGKPAMGIAPGTVQFTFAKLMPADPNVNGGLPYWQSYINRVETDDGSTDEPGKLAQSVQATTDSSGTLEETAPGHYRYTFATDVTAVTTANGHPIDVAWEPSLTHRVGLEIRLSGDAEVALAPFNPVFDFVPDNPGVEPTLTKDIADTANCNGCHLRLTLHGGPRNSVEYCVTCHNPGTVDQDTGNTVDMAHLAHSIHMGHDRGKGEDEEFEPIPYVIYGFGERKHDYGEVTYPQSQTYCETCHTASDTHPDGDAWNEGSSTTTCGGCHADGLVAQDFDPVTGQAQYVFDHTAAGADLDLGRIADGQCDTCHLGTIQSAGPALAIHSRIDGDQRFREAAGQNFTFEILDYSDPGPGEKPLITFRVSRPDGSAYDINNDPEFTDDGSALNLYVAWPTADIYNGGTDGSTFGKRDRGEGPVVVEEPGYPYRMYLAALQRDAVANEDGSYTVPFFERPEHLSGDPMIALGGHPAWFAQDADLQNTVQRAAATSAVFYPGTPRDFAVEADKCNTCHKQLQFHGSNRNGNVEVCLVCHTADTALEGEGFAFSRMIHSIHDASETYFGGRFAEVTYPQNIANCTTCHAEGKYNAARGTARSISTGPGGGDDTWLNDTATTPTAASCGTCHDDPAARGHFLTQGAQVDEEKSQILGPNPGEPNGQEACAVCHGPGSINDTTIYHNPGAE